MDQLTVSDSERLINLEDTIERGLKTFVEVGNALMEIRDSRLYRLQYDTFEDYCQERWEMVASRARQLIGAVGVVNNLSVTNVTLLPANEAQTRPLIKLSSDQQREIWPVIVDTAPNGKVTGAYAQKVVDDTYGKDEHLDAALNDETLPACEQCGQVYDGDACPDCSYRQMKPKTNRAGDAYTPQGYDACQTPPEAIDCLLPYIPDCIETVWEPAAGEGFLVEALNDSHFTVIESDILTGENFFDYGPPDCWECIITNPPYSIKYDWLKRCYELGKPFALLMPVEMLGAKTAQAMFAQYGIEVVFPNGRINFKMPNKGWEGSSAQFPTAWFTWGFNIGKELIFTVGELATTGGAL